MKKPVITIFLLVSLYQTVFAANFGFTDAQRDRECTANPSSVLCMQMSANITIGGQAPQSAGRSNIETFTGSRSALEGIDLEQITEAAANDNEDSTEDVPAEETRQPAAPRTVAPRPPAQNTPEPVITQTTVQPLARPVTSAEITAATNENVRSPIAPDAAAQTTTTTTRTETRTPAEAVVPAEAETEQPARPTIVDQEELDDKFDNFDADSCQWVEDMPRKIHEAPGCGRGRTTKICVGYVVCNRTVGEGKFIRASTCGEENCGNAADCTKDQHYWSSSAAENDQKYLGRDIRDLINGVSRQ